MPNNVQAGPATPVIVSTQPAEGGPALPAYIIQSGDGYQVQGGPARPIKVVTDPNYPRVGGPAIPVSVLASGSRQVAGGPAILVYYVNPPSTGPTYGPELVTNGGFETGNPPTGWPPTNSIAASLADARPGSAGTKSIKLTLSVGQIIGYVLQDVVALSGKTYSFSAWYKNVTADHVSLVVYDQSYGTQYFSVDKVESGWTNFTANFVSTSVGCHVGLYVVGVAGQYVEFDDVSIKEVL
jgi:hypothetical protein